MSMVVGGGSRAERARRPYTLGEEIANSVTHGIGALFGVVALVLLIVTSVQHRGGSVGLASAIVFGTSLFLLYLGSTLYHALPWPNVKHVFKIIDHSMIYLLIAGSYTPFTLITLRNDRGLMWFGIIWAIAAVGIGVEAFWAYRPRWLSALTYLAMGWLVVFTIRPLLANLDPSGLWLLIAGGLCYTVGTIFYVLKRVPYAHMVWHLFVLAGSVCHFLAVALYVL